MNFLKIRYIWEKRRILSKNLYQNEMCDMAGLAVGMLSGDPASIVEISLVLANKAFTAIQRIPYLHLMRYIEGVKAAEAEFGERVRLSDKLFSDEKTKNENALRVLKMVTSVDAERKIDFLINATRALLLDLIDVEMMFRIYKAINDNVLEDLEYLAENADKIGPFRANLNIMSLLHSGLTISAGLDLKASIEDQEYYISSFGLMVDCYSLSLNDDSRQEWYKNKFKR